MAETLDEAKAEAQSDAFGDSIGRLAERLGASAKAATVFGDPVERDGVTVIPVARVRWGVGGGSGRRRGEQNEGTGGGGGVQAAPLGFIELRGGQAHYRRVHDPLRLALAALLLPLTFAASAAVMMVTLTALARSLRGAIKLPARPHLPHVPQLPHGPRPFRMLSFCRACRCCGPRPE